MDIYFYLSKDDTQFLTKCFFSYFFTHGLFIIFLKLVKGSNWYYKIFRQYLAPILFRQFLFGLTFVWLVSNQDSLLLGYSLCVLWLFTFVLLINVHLSEIFTFLSFSFLENWILYTNLFYLFLLIFNKRSADDFKRDFVNDQNRLKRLLPTQSTGEKLVWVFLYSIVFVFGYSFFFYFVKH